jgi:hypothetical protein
MTTVPTTTTTITGQYEASLYANINSNIIRTRLLNRLEAICGNGPGESFTDHVIAFIPSDSRKSMNLPSAQEVQLRLSRKVKSSTKESSKDWYLSQYGHPETRPGRQVTVRPFIQTTLEGNGLLFMNALGYKFLFEYIRIGRMFIFEHIVNIYIYQVYKPNIQYSITNISILDQDWIIEAVAISPDAESIPKVSEVLLKLKGLLAGIAELRQIDHICLQQRTSERS